MKIKALLAVIATLFAFTLTPAAADTEDDGVKRLAIQVSDNLDGTMTKALNVAANFARMQSEAGNLYEIEIVTFNAGLHMLREDTSPVFDRIHSMNDSVPDLRFSACGNTIAGMTRKAGGTPPPIAEFAVVVPGGVGRLMKLDSEGWFVIRP